MISSLLALSVVSVLFLVGLAGTLLPVLPGTVIAFGGVLVHKLWMGDASVPWSFVWISALLAVATLLLDALFTWWGSRRFGATWKGALGAIIGGFAGIMVLGPILGLILGPIAGAIVFELMDGRHRSDALRAGWGAFVGNAAAFAVKLVCTLGIVGGFFIATP